ncbi:MAG: dihydrofolate reductase [Bacteroidia bacterium]|nr:dihydrofolate reductase [Bacteroidia bacterium]MDW8134684.1 dihydrofolate reductase [Bacteroidia bacterium]
MTERNWSIVASLSHPNRVIGKGGRLPWHLPLELRLFRELTWGGVLVMGRKTWQSIARPLPGREIWVLSRTQEPLPVTRVFPSKDSLLKALRTTEIPVFFTGGEKIFQWALSLPEVKKMYLSWIMGNYDGDTFFPSFSEEEWVPKEWEFFYDRCVPFLRVVYFRKQ